METLRAGGTSSDSSQGPGPGENKVVFYPAVTEPSPQPMASQIAPRAVYFESRRGYGPGAPAPSHSPGGRGGPGRHPAPPRRWRPHLGGGAALPPPRLLQLPAPLADPRGRHAG